MSVYVDDLKVVGLIRAGFCGWQDKRACHMMADTEEELETMRKRLRLRRSWRHGDHYDLTAHKRKQAIHNGAAGVSSEYLVSLRQSKRQSPDPNP